MSFFSSIVCTSLAHTLSHTLSGCPKSYRLDAQVVQVLCQKILELNFYLSRCYIFTHAPSPNLSVYLKKRDTKIKMEEFTCCLSGHTCVGHDVTILDVNHPAFCQKLYGVVGLTLLIYLIPIAQRPPNPFHNTWGQSGHMGKRTIYKESDDLSLSLAPSFSQPSLSALSCFCTKKRSNNSHTVLPDLFISLISLWQSHILWRHMKEHEL